MQENQTQTYKKLFLCKPNISMLNVHMKFGFGVAMLGFGASYKKVRCDSVHG